MTAAQIKNLRGLVTRAERIKQGLFLAEGDHLTGEAIREGAAQSILIMEGREERFENFLRCGLPIYILPERAFFQIADTKTPQGVAALCPLPPNTSPLQLG